MRIDKSKKIEKAVSKKDERLKDIEFKNGKLYATDGHILAVLTPEAHEKDEEGLLDKYTFKQANGEDVALLEDTCVYLNGASIPRPEKHSSPNYDKAIPAWKDKEDDSIHSVCLDTKLLSNLCAALGETKVKLRFKSSFGPVVVETRIYDFGVIMPLNKIK